jgi:hypothetical protein
MAKVAIADLALLGGVDCVCIKNISYKKKQRRPPAKRRKEEKPKPEEQGGLGFAYCVCFPP